MSERFAIGTFSRDGERFPGLVIGERVHDLRPAFGPHVTTGALLEDWDAGFARLQELAAGGLGAGTPVADLCVEVPIDPPGQVLWAGANYRRHLTQMHFAFERRHGNELADDELRPASAAYVEELAATGTPYVFPALAGSLSGAYDDVVLFGPGTDHDWELELAVVIGKPAWRVSRERAMEHVAAYTISNDVSTRDVMDRPNFPMTDFMATKIRPTFFPTGVPRAGGVRAGPLRPAGDAEGQRRGHAGRVDVGHHLRHRAADRVRLDPHRAAPRDLLLTGSPAGNAAHHGNRWLRPGDVMEGEITGLGVQRNVCVEESSFRPAGVS